MDTHDAESRWDRLTALLRPVHDRAAGTARRLTGTRTDGDDLLHEAVLRAFDKLHTLRDESRFGAWFYAVLLSLHRSRARRGFWRRAVSWDTAFATREEPVGEDGSERGDAAWRAGRLARALQSLSAEQREAVVLFEIDGYSIEDIAAMQAASVPAVKSRLVRGRDRLRRFYERFGWQSHRGPADTAAADRDTSRDASGLLFGGPAVAAGPGKEGAHE